MTQSKFYHTRGAIGVKPRMAPADNFVKHGVECLKKHIGADRLNMYSVIGKWENDYPRYHLTFNITPKVEGLKEFAFLVDLHSEMTITSSNDCLERYAAKFVAKIRKQLVANLDEAKKMLNRINGGEEKLAREALNNLKRLEAALSKLNEE